MHAHDRVVARGANETRFLAVVRAEMVVVDDAVGQRNACPDALSIEPTGKVYPLAAVAGPGAAAKGLRNVAGGEGLLEFNKVLAGHR